MFSAVFPETKTKYGMQCDTIAREADPRCLDVTFLELPNAQPNQNHSPIEVYDTSFLNEDFIPGMTTQAYIGKTTYVTAKQYSRISTLPEDRLYSVTRYTLPVYGLLLFYFVVTLWSYLARRLRSYFYSRAFVAQQMSGVASADPESSKFRRSPTSLPEAAAFNFFPLGHCSKIGGGGWLFLQKKRGAGLRLALRKEEKSASLRSQLNKSTHLRREQFCCLFGKLWKANVIKKRAWNQRKHLEFKVVASSL